MENLKYGWRKYTKQYHYHEPKDVHALCGKATYTINEFKKLEFLLDVEIKKSMKICGECRSIRKDSMKEIIIDEYEKSLGSWVNTKCPKCKTPVMYWNGRKNKENHLCTVCQELVIV